VRCCCGWAPFALSTRGVAKLSGSPSILECGLCPSPVVVEEAAALVTLSRKRQAGQTFEQQCLDPTQLPAEGDLLPDAVLQLHIGITRSGASLPMLRPCAELPPTHRSDCEPGLWFASLEQLPHRSQVNQQACQELEDLQGFWHNAEQPS